MNFRSAHAALVRTAASAILGFSGRGKAIRDLESSQWYDLVELRRLQEDKLRALLTSAYQNVPFYRHNLDEIGYRAGDTISLDDLHRFPILTKRTIQTHQLELRNPMIAGKVNHTGGSTGEPLTFTQDNAYWRANFADKMRTYAMCGYRVGDPALFLWGSDYDSAQHRGIRALLVDRLALNIRWVNSFALESDSLVSYVDELRAFRPKLVVGYASALYYLARVILEQGWRDRFPPPVGVQSSAEVLTSDMRGVIQDAFSAPVFDRYGCREVGNIAHECSMHHGLHILEESNLVEFINEDGNPVTPGSMGRIIVTNLNNYAMPLIRYEVGDAAILSYSACSCGRGLRLMEKVLGRSSDIITTPSGKIVHGEFFSHLFYNVAGVREFQVIQQTLQDMLVRIVPEQEYSQETEKFLTDTILEQCDPGFRVRFEYSDSLPPTASGKRRFTISDVSVSYGKSGEKGQ